MAEFFGFVVKDLLKAVHGGYGVAVRIPEFHIRIINQNLSRLAFNLFLVVRDRLQAVLLTAIVHRLELRRGSEIVKAFMNCRRVEGTFTWRHREKRSARDGEPLVLDPRVLEPVLKFNKMKIYYECDILIRF